jgi:hypothetical protein
LGHARWSGNGRCGEPVFDGQPINNHRPVLASAQVMRDLASRYEAA